MTMSNDVDQVERIIEHETTHENLALFICLMKSTSYFVAYNSNQIFNGLR
jgi:hypothetical protein